MLRLPQPGKIAVDLRHHITRHQIPAAERVLRIGPVVHKPDDRAKPAADFEHRFDPLHQIIGCPDRRRRAGGEGGLFDRLVGIFERGRARPLQRADDVFVVVPHEPVARLGDRLLARLGDMPAEQHAPLLAVDLCPVLLRGALGKTPLRRQGVQPFFRQRPDRDDADAVLAGQGHARRADLRRGGERHLLLQRQ